MSKSYALAGLRFGFIVAQPQVIEQLLKVKDSYNCDTLAIAGATAAIDDQAWLNKNRTRIIATRERMAPDNEIRSFDVNYTPIVSPTMLPNLFLIMSSASLTMRSTNSWTVGISLINPIV